MGEPPGPARRGNTYAWWLILALVGLDYFSTLAYLPSIAVDAAGPLAPLAVLAVVVVTLLGALPVYAYIVGRSHGGRGAIALLEHRVRGWSGKLLILLLLGFVATDFIITRSLSVADASIHLTHNPFWQGEVDWLTQNKESVRAGFPGLLQGSFFDFWNEQLVLTLILSMLAFAFWAWVKRGFTPNFLRLAVVIVGVYLLLVAVVIISGLVGLATHPDLLSAWGERVARQPAWAGAGNDVALVFRLLVVALFAFPQLALGLSGFELSMVNAPLVRGDADDDPEEPRGRIRNTRRMLLAAALIMSLFLPAAVFVVTVLVPGEALAGPGGAVHRSLAYLAHGGTLDNGLPASALNPLFGAWFGSVFDVATVLILCLAGASVTISLRDLIPQYLQRFGMQLQWAHKVGVITHLFNAVILLVVLVFRASVAAQQWAYATTVLVLLTGGALAALRDVQYRWLGSWLRPLVMAPFLLICAFFLGMASLTMGFNLSGLAIALGFVVTVYATAFFSRWLRSTELRFHGFTFADEASRKRWEEIRLLEFQVLVPHRPGRHSLKDKEQAIRRRHHLGPEMTIIFVEVELGDTSDFYHAPVMQIVQEDGLEVIRVSSCCSIAHVVASIALEFRIVGRPPEIHFGWSHESPLAANLNFLLFGEGNIPWMVHELVRKAEPDLAKQPRVVIG
jgi:hypothetical protein